MNIHDVDGLKFLLVKKSFVILSFSFKSFGVLSYFINFQPRFDYDTY